MNRKDSFSSKLGSLLRYSMCAYLSPGLSLALSLARMARMNEASACFENSI